MKKILFFGALVAMLLGTAACSSDMEPSMGDNMVRFTIEMPGNIDSRAIADGNTANQLTVAVYDQDGNELPDIRVNKEIPHQTTVEFKLVKGQTYSFAFWAQAEGAPYTFDTANKTVNVSYEGAKSNDEKRDAFYAYRADLTVNGPIEEVVVLTRPFCQLNYGASDYADAIKAGIEATTSAVTVNHAATSFNLSTGATDGDVEVTFTKEILPNEITDDENNPDILVVNETNYDWMAMNYFLVPNNQATIETSLQLYEGDATEAVRDITVPNVPVQKNHRTNIVGNLFTEDVNFLVIIDERFDQPDYIRDLNRPEVTDGKLLVNGIEFDDLAAAVAAANGNIVYMGKGTYDTQISVGDGETVNLAAGKGLNRDEVVINKQIKATAGATLQLDGITVKGNAAANEPGINAESATVKLNAVTLTGNRGMNIFGNCNVTIDNSELIGTGTYSRGLNIGDGNNTVIVKGSKISATYYAFNLIGSALNENITVTNSEVNTGWAITNIWGKNCNIDFDNCLLNSVNDKTYNADGWNNFSAFVYNTDASNHAANNVVTINNSSIKVESTKGNKQSLVGYEGTNNQTIMKNVNIIGINTNTNGEPITFRASTYPTLCSDLFDNDWNFIGTNEMMSTRFNWSDNVTCNWDGVNLNLVEYINVE